MKESTISIAEGKKGFSRLIQDTCKKREEIIVTKRGKPVAVIVPYEEYRKSKRIRGYKKIMETRKVFLKTGIHSGEVYRQSRKELEKR